MVKTLDKVIVNKYLLDSQLEWLGRYLSRYTLGISDFSSSRANCSLYYRYYRILSIFSGIN
jgi:hypothetical protein